MGNDTNDQSANSLGQEKTKRAGAFSISANPAIGEADAGEVHKYEVAPAGRRLRASVRGSRRAARDFILKTRFSSLLMIRGGCSPLGFRLTSIRHAMRGGLQTCLGSRRLMERRNDRRNHARARN
jgi:hypothetical protein